MLDIGDIGAQKFSQRIFVKRINELDAGSVNGINLFVFMFLSLPLAGIFIGTFPPYFSGDNFALYLMYANLSYLSLLLFFNLKSKKERPAEFFYLIYMLFYYTIPGIAHICVGTFPVYNQHYDSNDIVRGAFTVTLFVIAVSIGYEINKISRVKLSKTSEIKLSAGAWTLLGIGVLAAIRLGVSFFLVSRGERQIPSYVGEPLDLISEALARQLPFIALLAAGVMLTYKRTVMRFVLFFAAGATFLLLNDPLAIPRSLIASYFIAALIIFKKMSKTVKVIVLSILVFAQFSIFPMLSALQRGDINEYLKGSALDSFVSNGDFDGFQSTISIGLYATNTGFKLGHNLLSAILFFVPRSVWPDKSIGTGGEAGIYMRYAFINLSAPLPSEFFVDFGFFGVILGGVFSGWVLRWWDIRVAQYRFAKKRVQIVPFACIIGWIFILFRGSLVGTLGPIGVPFFISMLLIAWSKQSVAKSSFEPQEI